MLQFLLAKKSLCDRFDCCHLTGNHAFSCSNRTYLCRVKVKFEVRKMFNCHGGYVHYYGMRISHVMSYNCIILKFYIIAAYIENTSNCICSCAMCVHYIIMHVHHYMCDFITVTYNSYKKCIKLLQVSYRKLMRNWLLFLVTFVDKS